MIDLKAIRIEKGYTQQSLADEAGVLRSVIANIESGRFKPSIDNAKKLAAVLGFDWYLFFSD